MNPTHPSARHKAGSPTRAEHTQIPTPGVPPGPARPCAERRRWVYGDGPDALGHPHPLRGHAGWEGATSFSASVSPAGGWEDVSHFGTAMTNRAVTGGDGHSTRLFRGGYFYPWVSQQGAQRGPVPPSQPGLNPSPLPVPPPAPAPAVWGGLPRSHAHPVTPVYPFWLYLNPFPTPPAGH